MSKLNFKGEEEGHNFWQNYTDLMSGLLIVFIIASIVAWFGYKEVTEVLEQEYGNIKVTLEQFKMIKEVKKAHEELESDYFHYNEEFQRFECKLDINFKPNQSNIPVEKIDSLKNAGNELVNKILSKFKESDIISFKIIIEGRAAKFLNQGSRTANEAANKKAWHVMEKISYERALSLYNLWKEEYYIESIENMNGEVFVSGSGFGGQGRYANIPGEEEKNKTFIIQVIPYIK